MIAFISEPGCISKLAEANYYESIVAVLDKAEEKILQGDCGGVDFNSLLDEYREGAAAYKTSLTRFTNKAKEVNTYDIVQPTVSWA